MQWTFHATPRHSTPHHTAPWHSSNPSSHLLPTADGPLQGLPGTREVYLQSETTPPPPPSSGSPTGPPQPPQRSAFKLEGTQAAALRTGQRVSITGRRLGGLGDGTERLVVTGVVTLEEPSYSSSGAQQGVKITPPQPSGSAGAGGRRLKQFELQEPVVVGGGGSGEAPPAGLPTSQLSLEAAEVSTLVLAISFENCTRNIGGNYSKPWWSQQVGAGQPGGGVELTVGLGFVSLSFWLSLLPMLVLPHLRHPTMLVVAQYLPTCPPDHHHHHTCFPGGPPPPPPDPLRRRTWRR